MGTEVVEQWETDRELMRKHIDRLETQTVADVQLISTLRTALAAERQKTEEMQEKVLAGSTMYEALADMVSDRLDLSMATLDFAQTALVEAAKVGFPLLNRPLSNKPKAGMDGYQ